MRGADDAAAALRCAALRCAAHAAAASAVRRLDVQTQAGESSQSAGSGSKQTAAGPAAGARLTALTLRPSPVNLFRYPARLLVELLVTKTSCLPCRQPGSQAARQPGQVQQSGAGGCQGVGVGKTKTTPWQEVRCNAGLFKRKLGSQRLQTPI